MNDKRVKIVELELSTTKNGKPYKACTLEDGRKLNFFSWYSIYPLVRLGTLIRDDEITQDGEYWTWNDPREEKKKVKTGDEKIDKAMQRKEGSIKTFQNNKEKGIMLASSIRLATDVALAQITDTSDEAIQESIRKWRSWFLEEWDNLDIDNAPPFTS